MLILQSNLDYSKCQGPQESFPIISSSNDRNRGVSGYFRKSSDVFATSAHVNREVIRKSVKALKKMSSLEMSSLEVVASLSLMLCRSENAEKKRKSELTSLLTSTIYIVHVHVRTIFTN